MNFIEPHNLHWLWLAVPPLLLWLFRRQAKRVPVSTLLFFRSLAREHQESAWLRQLKRWLSLLLTLLVILFAALVLSRPSMDGAADSQQAMVVLLDRSASMGAMSSGVSRMEQAKALISRRIRALPESTIVSLVLYADSVEVAISRTRNKRELLRRLAEVESLPVEDRLPPAWLAAKRLAALDVPATILHVSDTALPDASLPTDGLRYERGGVEETDAVNVGITGFDLRPAPLERHKYEAFLRIGSAAANPSTVTTALEISIGGRLVQLRELELSPGKEVPLSLPLEGPSGELLEVRIKTPGDQLGIDDVLLVPLPTAKPLVVAWISSQPDPFTDLALGSMVDAGKVEVLRGTAEQWPLTVKPDVYVFEQWLPEDWTPDAPVVSLTPTGALGTLAFRPLPRGVPVERFRTLNAEHPVLHGVASARLSITHTTQLSAGAGLEALWMTASSPLLLAGESAGQRMVVTAFSPARSESLALLPAFPLLLANAIQWCASADSPASNSGVSRTGSHLKTRAPVQWTSWDGQNITTRITPPTGDSLTLHQLGAWQTEDGQRGATTLTSLQETNVPATSTQPMENGSLTTASLRSWSIITLLIGIILLLLLLESWLFHRRAVY
jgi:hypothetical protein